MASFKALAKLAAGTLVLGIGGATGYLALRRLIAGRIALPPAFDASRETFESLSGGTISYYVDRRGTGRPLVLIHSINAAASAYEMKPFFERYRGGRPVIAVDLPGFGFSDRRDRVYSPALYTSVVMALLQRVAGADVPADVVALSLSAEFAARAARDRPDLFHTLTVVSPTGLAHDARSSTEMTKQNPILGMPVVGAAAFEALVSRPSLSFFLGKSFVGPVDPGLEAYAYATSHQPGARHAPFYFLSGALFTPRVDEAVYEKVTVPTLVLFDEDGFTDFAKLGALLGRSRKWSSARIVPSSGLPHFEMAEETFAALDAFWLRIAGEAEHVSRDDGLKPFAD